MPRLHEPRVHEVAERLRAHGPGVITSPDVRRRVCHEGAVGYAPPRALLQRGPSVHSAAVRLQQLHPAQGLEPIVPLPAGAAASNSTSCVRRNLHIRSQIPHREFWFHTRRRKRRTEIAGSDAVRPTPPCDGGGMGSIVVVDHELPHPPHAQA